MCHKFSLNSLKFESKPPKLKFRSHEYDFQIRMTKKINTYNFNTTTTITMKLPMSLYNEPM